MNHRAREVRRFRMRFLGAVAFTAGLVLVGTVGFAIMPGWSLSDAFYMTVITVSAVGYGEVQLLDDGGRLFASFLIMGGVVSLAIWFALITSTLVEMDLAHMFRRRRTMKSIDKLKNHMIVCGTGRTGRHVIKEFLGAGTDYVAIERETEHAELVRDLDERALVIEGDATRDDVLLAAGIRRASGLVTTLSADTDNVFVCLTARDLNPELTIVGRARSEDAVSKIRKAGADHVVSPNATGGMRMASLVLRPHVMSFLDVATRNDEMELLLEQIPVPGDSSLAGRTLAEAAIPAKTGLLVVAIQHEGQPDGFRYNPGPEETVHAGDLLIVLGPPNQIDDLRNVLA